MDKFGIFKLLNSFFPSSEPQSSSADAKTDALSSLINSLSEQTSTKNSQQTAQQKMQKEPAPQKPLQASMLSVMSSHDDFIKRVKSKNNQNNP